MIKEEFYTIGGMSCAACSSAVERVTRKLDGVVRSDVNLTTGKLLIRYDDEKVTPELIIGKVTKAGFSCEPANRQKKPAEKKRTADTPQIVRLTGSWIFTGLLLYVSMGSMLPHPVPLPALFDMHANPVNFAVLQLLLTIPVLVWGKHFFVNGFSALLHRNPNMNSLVALGSACSFAYSLVLTFLISANPAHVHHLYYESAAVVLTFIMTGKYLESRSTAKTKDAITALMKLAPDTALLVRNDTVTEVATDSLKPGDVILVKPGSRIPADGTVSEGSSSVDESMLTGESLPVDKAKGGTVTGGSMNLNGMLHVTVTKTGADSTLSQIIRCMEDAQGKKAPIAKIADRISGVFVPIVMGIACAAGIAWFAAGMDAAFVLRIVTSVLVIACPCALGLATPAAIMVGTGLGAANGILIRNGEALETTGKITAAVLDKTGTVTEGKPKVTAVLSEKGVNERHVLAYAALAESGSEHPLARAIIAAEKAARSPGDAATAGGKVISFKNIPGKGIVARAELKGSQYFIYAGNRRFMDEESIGVPAETETKAESLTKQGHTITYVASERIDSGGKSYGQAALQGLIGISDTVRETSIEAVRMLKNAGISVHLLTGDNKNAAEHIAKQIGADTVKAEVLPQEKAEAVKNLQRAGERVMMVGDGINDAPALVQADCGIAVGGGSDIAVDAGSIVLMKGDLRDAAKAVKLSRLTLRTIKQNLFWAFLYNVVGIPIAAGALYPFTGTLLTPMIAGFAMSVSSVCVVTNALRLKTKKL